MRMYDVANAGRSGTALCVLPPKLRNQKLSLRRISSKYPRKLVWIICGLQSTSATHFSYSSKCRRTSLRKTYHRVFDFSNQKARVRAIFCDKRLIPCFRRCDVLTSTPHSKNTPYNRFSSNYHRKLGSQLEGLLIIETRKHSRAGERVFRPRKESFYFARI